MATLLLELFSEEIPARMQAPAAEQLRGAVVAGLTKLGYAVDGAESFVSPRHLAVRVHNLPAKQADTSEERKGPRANAPQAAIDGFLRSTGLTLEQLELRGDTYFAMIESKGRETAEALVPMLNDVLANFAWPKSMRWGSNEKSWVRPLHSIIALLDEQVLPVEWAHVKAANSTQGHRFLAHGTLTIKNPNEYEATLKAADVWVEAEARKAAILAQLEIAAAKLKLNLKYDDRLLSEVTGLVEFPAVLAGRIDAQYMHLPAEVLISEMKEHQRYFALLNEDGSLADRFLITTNMDPARMSDGGAAVIAGNERVLRARLADGKFFWEQDQKLRLEDWGKKLDTMVFHAKLGSMAERVQRITKIAVALAHKVGADEVLVERAAHLAKADLTSGMVGEFPDLQGVMGRYYAVAQGESREVAEAIAEHYKPVGANDDAPTAPVSIAVALADKLDVLAGMFSVGEKPTGSKDPFALRRAALGVLRIIRQNGLALSLYDALELAVSQAFESAEAAEELVLVQRATASGAALRVETVTSDFSEEREEQVIEELLSFFQDRLKVALRDDGVRHDAVEAVLTDDADDMQDICLRASALQEFLQTPAGERLAAGYKRAANILRAEEKKDGRDYNQPVRKDVLKEQQEHDLHDALQALEATIEPLLASADYSRAMHALSLLSAPVDSFFEVILVNDSAAEIRANRLALLSAFRKQVQRIANFDKLQG